LGKRRRKLSCRRWEKKKRGEEPSRKMKKIK